MRDRANRALVHLRAQWAGFLALFLVLTGGVAYAADTIGSSDVINESLLSEDLKNNNILGADLKNNQVYSGDVRDDTLVGGGLVGADIKEDTLGKVPDADMLDGQDSAAFLASDAKAADADKLDGMSSEAFKVGCPSNWKAVAGLCYEDPDSFGHTLPQAVERCRQLGGRLPTYTELVALKKSGLALDSSLLEDWTASSVGDDLTIYINSTDSNNMDGVRANTTSSWARCVKTPVNALGFP